MYPKLYNKNETEFIHNGLGLLTGTISAVATEELNGMFELNMEYDNEGFLADVIAEEMIIKAKANDKQDEQLFRIYSITKNHQNDNLIIDAQHITYDLGNNFVEELEARNLTKRQVMEQIGASTTYPHAFNITSSNATTQSSTSLYRTNPLQMIAGTQGSVLQIWGGQIERDNYHLIMHDRRGSDDGVLVTYKKNLTGLSAKFDISNLVTRIFPYKFIEATDDEPEQLITVPGKYIDSPHVDDYEMPYILPVDFSHEYDIETSQDLLDASQNWFIETGRDKPKVEMEVQFEHLWETEEYKDVAALELVGMGDTITVKHSKLNVEGNAIVNRIEYDVIAEKNNAVDVGNVRAKFTDKVNSVGNIVERVEQAEQSANQAIQAANGKNKIYYGPDEPEGSFNEGDLWFRVVDGEYTRTYRFDGIQWQLVVSKDVADIEEVANTARNNASEAVEKANLATSNANEAISEAQTAFDNAQDAISTADGASDLASTVNDLAQSLQGTVSGHSTTITDIENELSRKMTTIDADAKYATQSALQQTSQSLSSDIVAVQGNLDSLEIGGRNYARNTHKEYKTYNMNNRWRIQIFRENMNEIGLKAGDVITYSAYINPINGYGGAVRIDFYKDNGDYTQISGNTISANTGEGLSTLTHTIPSGYDDIRLTILNESAGSDLRYTFELKQVMLEKGNKSTDWSPAPEDIQHQFSSINQTVDDITTRVGDSEDNISTLQQTSQSFATRIGNAEGDITSITQTIQGIQNTVSNKADSSTVTQLADVVDTKITKGQADGWYATQSQLTQTASSLQSTITGVRDDLDGLEIGGRNYFSVRNYLKNNTTSRYDESEKGALIIKGTDGSSTDYYTKIADLEPNSNYTLSFSESMNNRFILVDENGDGTHQKGFEWNDDNTIANFKTGSNIVAITGKFFPYNTSYPREVFVQLEKGNKATDWSPAPEDMATQSQFSQLSDNINLRVMKNDIINQINISTESILISGKKLILDGDTTVNGTFRVGDANITSVDAGKMTTGTLDAGRISVINLSANSITGGILQAQNSNTTFNLNTGSLTMRNVNFSLGGNAKIHFTDRANDLYYTNQSVYGGIKFDHSLGGGGRPLAAFGVSDNAFDVNDSSWNGIRVHSGWVENNVTGVMTNIVSNQLWLNSDPQYSAGGWVFENTYPQNRNRALYGMNDFSYDLGFAGGGEFSNAYVDTIVTDRIEGWDDLLFRNRYSNSDVGWTMKLAYENNSTVDFYPIYTSGNYYNIGRSSNRINRAYLNIVEGNSIGQSSNPHSYVYTDYLIEGSDKSIKENVTDSQLGLGFIKDVHVVDFKMKDSGKYKSGVIAQELAATLTAHNVDLNRQSMVFSNDEVMGVAYTQLIAPTIKAIQELDSKVDDEVTTLRKQNEHLILKVADLERRINQLEAS